MWLTNYIKSYFFKFLKFEAFLFNHKSLISLDSCFKLMCFKAEKSFKIWIIFYGLLLSMWFIFQLHKFESAFGILISCNKFNIAWVNVFISLLYTCDKSYIYLYWKKKKNVWQPAFGVLNFFTLLLLNLSIFIYKNCKKTF